MAGIPSTLEDYTIDNIQLGRQIGSGANGRVLEAKWEGITVAVKEIFSIFISEISEPEFLSFRNSFLRECEQISRLRHPNVVRFIGIYNPTGARVPSLVMERLHCSLTNQLERNSYIPYAVKLSIINDVALGLRYLHSRTPPIIHRDLSSNNVLISKGMEGKIGDLGAARLADLRRQSRVSIAPGTIDFMPPEALVAGENTLCDKLDLFSFGCVMLHTLSHEWPAPSVAVVTDPVTFEVKARTEVQRRSSYFAKIDRSRSQSGVLIPWIESCLSNVPENRTSIVRVCDQLEGLVDREFKHVPTDDLTVCALREELKRKDAEIQRKDAEIQRKDIKIQRKDAEIYENHMVIQNLQGESLLPKQTNKSSTDFWSRLTLTWQACADLPQQLWATSAVELDGKVYVAARDDKFAFWSPYVFDTSTGHWSTIPGPQCVSYSLAAVPDRKQLLAIGGHLVMDDVIEMSSKVFTWDVDAKKWLTTYPNMHTARCLASSVTHGSTVIVAGGMVHSKPVAFTRSVEVLYIKEDTFFSKSCWVVVEQLPFVVWCAIPVVIGDDLYIAQGFDDDPGSSTCSILTTSMPELLQSRNKHTSTSKVWKKLPDMPYSSFSINYYRGRLIVFSGGQVAEQPHQNLPAANFVPLIHLYNPITRSWDYVGDVPSGYLLCRSVHISEDSILFIGGLTGTRIEDEHLMTTCLLLTITSF